MKLIRVRCPLCGDVDLSSSDITLVVYRDVPTRSHYTFRCAVCRRSVCKPAQEDVVSALSLAGVRPKEAELPNEPARRVAAPALSTDDLLDFILALAATATPATHCQPPAEALEEKSGPPLTRDDLLDFMLLLRATDLVTTQVSERAGSAAAGGRAPTRQIPKWGV